MDKLTYKVKEQSSTRIFVVFLLILIEINNKKLDIG